MGNSICSFRFAGYGRQASGGRHGSVRQSVGFMGMLRYAYVWVIAPLAARVARGNGWVDGWMGGWMGD